MAQRVEPRDSLEDFPTPPWSTRALIEHVIAPRCDLRPLTCLEPACGRGHMARTLAEYFGTVMASDVHPYGFGEVFDFTDTGSTVPPADWVITNPPFRLAEPFLLRALLWRASAWPCCSGPPSWRASAGTSASSRPIPRARSPSTSSVCRC